MIRTLLLCVLLLSGCMGFGRDYGDQYPVGALLSTSCATVRSFDESIRSSPGLHSPDTFVAYESWPGMGRGHVFLIRPLLDELPGSAPEILRSIDPRRRSFWLEATLTDGAIEAGSIFEAYVPAKEKKYSDNSTIIYREAILVRGELIFACGNKYLMLVQANPFSVSKVESEWPRVRKNFDIFKENVIWPKSPVEGK